MIVVKYKTKAKKNEKSYILLDCKEIKKQIQLQKQKRNDEMKLRHQITCNYRQLPVFVVGFGILNVWPRVVLKRHMKSAAICKT